MGAGGGCLDIFSLVYHFSFLSPSLWETARYRLKYCLKGPLSPKQPTNQQPSVWEGPKTTNQHPCLWKTASRYLDDLLEINNNFFDSMVNRIYPLELQLNKTNVSDAEASFLDLHLSISGGFVKTKIYGKRDDFDFDFSFSRWLCSSFGILWCLYFLTCSICSSF